MFEHLKEQPKDKILALMQAYKDDPRDDKIDLGVGRLQEPAGRDPDHARRQGSRAPLVGRGNHQGLYRAGGWIPRFRTR